MLLKWAGTTACLLHILIGILFIVMEREALFGPALPSLDRERPVLIGDPSGNSDDQNDTTEPPAGGGQPEQTEAVSENALESAVAEPEDPGEQYAEPAPQEIAEPQPELPPQPQTPRVAAPMRQLPNPEARQARWRRKSPEAEHPQEDRPRRSPFRSDGQALHEAFTNYRAATENVRSAKNGSPTGSGSGDKKVLWGERAQKNAAQLEIDLYIRRLMRALKDRAAFYEETVSVTQSVHTRVSVVMVIERSGTLRHIEVRPSTGVADIDRAIEQFCRYATIPPLPKTFPDNELVLPIQVRIEQAAGVHRMRFTVDTP